MNNNYVIDYVNENEYKKRERTVKKYDIGVYKKLVFDVYPMLKSGQFVGDIISKNKKENSIKFELKLPCNKMFEKVHGEMKLHYVVYYDQMLVLLDTISPESILEEGYRSELTTYKGVVISKSNPQRDIFKINLISMLNK